MSEQAADDSKWPEQLLGRLEAAFRKALDIDQVALYLEKLECMHQAAATKAVEHCIEHCRYFPSVSELFEAEQKTRSPEYAGGQRPKAPWYMAEDVQEIARRGEWSQALPDALYMQRVDALRNGDHETADRLLRQGRAELIEQVADLYRSALAAGRISQAQCDEALQELADRQAMTPRRLAQMRGELQISGAGAA